MLEGLSNRVPTSEELDRAERAVWDAKNPVEWVEMSLWRIQTGGRTVGVDLEIPTELAEPLTAEQAWQLTYFANGVTTCGEDLVEWAGQIRNHVRGVYQDTLDAIVSRERWEAEEGGNDDA